jgi:hypothetical protein
MATHRRVRAFPCFSPSRSRRSSSTVFQRYRASLTAVQCPLTGRTLKPIYVATGAALATSRRARSSNWALIATMIVLKDISAAPAAGVRTTPQAYATPAAKGMAKVRRIFPPCRAGAWGLTDWEQRIFARQREILPGYKELKER